MKKYTPSRRKFIKRGAGLAACSYAASLGLLPLSARVAADEADDYKALVYIFLAGGNDSFNMVAPLGDGALRTRYEEGRRNVALSSDSLNPLNLRSDPNITGGDEQSGFGMHPNCGDMAEMFNAGELSVVCNVGNLFEPTTRASYMDGLASLPPQLFSHADQQRQFQSEPSLPFRFGWGGRIAELLQSFNEGVNVSPLISTSGLNTFQVSQDSLISPYVMRRTGLTRLNSFNGRRRTMIESAMSAPSDHLMAAKIREVFASARTAETVVSGAFDIADNNGVDYDEIFMPAGETPVAQQLQVVAKMIAGKAVSGNKRPVYFVQMGGFDTHKNILSDHAELMRDLNAALKSFRDALVAQGDFDCALTTVGSEFGRTFTPNGSDAGAGTDHAWGGHALVMGGMIEGGHFYGEYPDLKIGESLDVDNSRGRWIPTTSTSQFSAVMANWFGVPEDDLGLLFPSLINFPSPFTPEANLNFIKAGV